MPDAHAVLIVNQDVGFLFWLAELFGEIGYQAFPALNCSQALAVVRSLDLTPDLVFIDPDLSGVPRLLESLEKQGAPLRIVVTGDDSVLRAAGVRYDAVLGPTKGSEPVSRADWLRKIRRLVAQFGFDSGLPLARREEDG